MSAPDLSALEAQLRAGRDDWDAWLVYGDWLLEQGDVRGSLVGIEHRLAKGALAAEECLDLTDRAASLLAAHQRRWLSDAIIPEGTQLHWRCGFVIGVALRCNEDLAPALAAIEDLCALPVARLFSRLDLSGNYMGPAGAQVLVRSPLLSSLDALLVSGNALGDKGVLVLVDRFDAPCSLTALDLSLNGIGDDGARAIARSKMLPTLTKLDLSRNRISEGCADLLRRKGAQIRL